MKIYVAHSSNFDFKNELYVPLRNSPLNTQHHIILPHETDEFLNTKEIIKSADMVVAEVSYPSTGEGIELGWAESFGVPIICMHKQDVKPSRSVAALTANIFSYATPAEMLEKLTAALKNRN